MTLFSLQSRRHFGERVLIIFLMKIMAALFDFNDSGRLGRERNLYQGGGQRSMVNNKERDVGRGVEIIHVTDHCYFANSVRPRTEFLIGTVKLQTSTTRPSPAPYPRRPV